MEEQHYLCSVEQKKPQNFCLQFHAADLSQLKLHSKIQIFNLEMTLQQWFQHGTNMECLCYHSSAVKAALTLLALDSRKHQFCDRGFRCVHRLQYSRLPYIKKYPTRDKIQVPHVL